MKSSLLFLSLAASTSFFAFSPAARAGIEACGDIHVEGNAACQLEVEGGCTAQCTPVSFHASCAAELTATCDGQCTGSASLECTGSCDIGSCRARCDVDPGNFSCEGECSAQAEAQCAGECEASANRGECEASCRATFSSRCEASCSGTPPTADCEARCEASCEGRCDAEANLDCQIDCQADGFAKCKADMQGGCELACSKPEGALFCDGQFIDHGGNLDACIAALDAYLDVRVDASSRGTATGDCSGNRCTANAEGDAQASASCAYGALPVGGSAGLASLLGLVAVAGGRRRRSTR